MNDFNLQIIYDSRMEYLYGLLLTLKLVGTCLILGVVLAIGLALLRCSRNPWVSKPVWAFTYYMRGTPMLIQLFIVYNGFAGLEWVQEQWAAENPLILPFREPYFCALFTFTLNTAAYTTEIFAGAMKNIAYGEIEAARAIGMSWFTMIRRIVLPSALRRSIPAYSNEVIFMLQGSSIASAVTLVDLTGAGRNVYSKYYAPFEGFIAAGVIYLILTFLLLGLFRLAEKRWLAYLAPRKH
ncbi:ABC transporter permease [Leeia sp.]|uniref:ABC transporter permease n=1 Tax=Leeia sp. TaxID=2884678 RepID=UPI0035AE8379